MKFVIAIGVVVLLGIAFRLAVPRLVNNSVATGIVVGQDGSHLGDCPNTPNCVSSESSSASHKVERFTLKKGADKAIDTLANIIESQPGTAIVQKDDRYLHATYTTKIMGYVDDVEFLVVDDPQKATSKKATSKAFRYAVPRGLARAIWEPMPSECSSFAPMRQASCDNHTHSPTKRAFSPISL